MTERNVRAGRTPSPIVLAKIGIALNKPTTSRLSLRFSTVLADRSALPQIDDGQNLVMKNNNVAIQKQTTKNKKKTYCDPDEFLHLLHSP
jgi:hypothetical protein